MASKAYPTVQTGHKSQFNIILSLSDQLQKLFPLISTNKCRFAGINPIQSFRNNNFNESFSKNDDSKVDFVAQNNDVISYGIHSVIQYSDININT